MYPKLNDGMLDQNVGLNSEKAQVLEIYVHKRKTSEGEN